MLTTSKGHHLRPSRPSGWLTVVSGAAVVAGFAFLQTAILLGQKGGDEITDNLWLAVPALVCVAGAVVSVVAGLVATLRDRQWSPLVIVAFILGVFVVLFVAAELAFPH